MEDGKKKKQSRFPVVTRPRFEPRPAPNITKEQVFLQEVFSGGMRNQTWGTGENLPKFDRTLMSGGGLIKSGDFGETGAMFGARRVRWREDLLE